MSEADEAAVAARAYERGIQTFLGIELLAAPGALVPRAETELLGRTALHKLEALRAAAGGRELCVVDMCTGSGNLACAIAMLAPDTRVWASDLTDGCVSLARRNVDKLGLGDRVTVVQGDLFAPLLDKGLEGAVDVCVCNPPYISTGRLDERADLTAEPREAFDGGPYGLSVHQRVVRDALPLLRVGGWLCFEIGLGQDRQVKILFDRTRAYDAVETSKNETGGVRGMAGRKKG